MNEKITSQQLFGQLDFKLIRTDSDFKEDSVREVIILPIFKELGYIQENIIRSKTLQHPFLKIGSKKRPINLIPDYTLKVENNFAWVLDAKSPNQKIINDDNVEQVYSYATHPEIRSNYFALCNGLEFSVFRTADTDRPILFFEIENIENHWEELKQLLAPTSFQIGKNFTYDTTTATAKPKGDFEYSNRPLLEEIPVRKQQAKRHFGVHGYFTKQTWNVVAEYIKNFSKPGDLVLDPFGGSGVTAIEALMNNRSGINIDLNPMAVSISYEYDPTDVLKMPQLMAEANNEVYIKEKNEDFLTIMRGLLGQKKRIHIHVGTVINPEIETIVANEENTNKQILALAQVIDDAIVTNYQLWPTNFIAYDLLYKTNQYAHLYSEQQKSLFERRLEMRINHDNPLVLEGFLAMYANPVVNRKHKNTI